MNPDDDQFLPPGFLAAAADNTGSPATGPGSYAAYDILRLVLRTEQDKRDATIGVQSSTQLVEEFVGHLHAVFAAGVRERQEVRVTIKGL